MDDGSASIEGVLGWLMRGVPFKERKLFQRATAWVAALVIFGSQLRESGRSAEHMMLIGLGEPFMDRKIFDRIEYCERHKISTLLSTNGTFLDEQLGAKLLDSPLEHITLSFDGATKRSYEYYRKGAKF